MELNFDSLKQEIYSLYLCICKAHFLDNEHDLERSDFDKVLGRVCVAHLEDKVTHDEFVTLSGYLVRTYQLYLLENKGVS